MKCPFCQHGLTLDTLELHWECTNCHTPYIDRSSGVLYILPRDSAWAPTEIISTLQGLLFKAGIRFEGDGDLVVRSMVEGMEGVEIWRYPST